MSAYSLNREEYRKTARRAAAEGCVLLKNDKNILPLKEGSSVAVFGRIQFDYYKAGLGSGGLVNTEYTVGIREGLEANGRVRQNESVTEAYRVWLRDNPFDEGEGWGKVPWSQKEMP
ncbi:MAG: glycoside hydrolase family 3 C-terminal domain-containing protein, partial [Spirochaetales bacterium]|nr:glycoside hydrolase family 3 C-terminal domain-containing protein [Spirochaetales bacterium]